MSPDQKHIAVIIPGLGDDNSGSGRLIESLTNHWSKLGIEPLIHSVLWRDGESFEPKLVRLLSLIDSLSKDNKVSLVGASAGASLAFNAFRQRPNTVHRAVNVCGRLRAGNHRIRSLDKMARTSIAFKQSVLAFQNAEHELDEKERSRLMTIRPFFGDELVPRDTASLDGAHNIWIFTPEHGLSIGLSLKFAGPIISFLNQPHT